MMTTGFAERGGCVGSDLRTRAMLVSGDGDDGKISPDRTDDCGG